MGIEKKGGFLLVMDAHNVVKQTKIRSTIFHVVCIRKVVEEGLLPMGLPGVF